MRALRRGLAVTSAGVVAAGVLAAAAPTATASDPDRRHGRLAFGIDVGGNVDIYSVRTDGRRLRRLTTDPGFDACADWSVGREIAWCGQRAGITEIWTMRDDGRRQRQLTDLGGSALFPDWSPDGQQIAFSSGALPAAGQQPVADIYVMRRDGSGITRLTDDPGGERYPAWSPNGMQIAFVSDRSGTPQVWTMDADGSDQRQVTTDPAPKGQTPEWRPDGGKIAYATTQPGAADIFVMDPDGTDVTQITSGPQLEFGLSWSPDGRQLSFTDTTDRTVYVMQADGSGRRAVRPLGLQFATTWKPARAR